MIIETERLLLRPYRVSDASAVHAYGSDPLVTQYTDFGPNTWDDTLAFLQTATKPVPPKIELAVTLRGDDHVVGGTGAWPEAPGIWEMGWILRRDLWGHGYMTEGAAALLAEVLKRDDVESVFARARPENRASHRVMEKIGMSFVEVIPRDKKVRGRWVDSHVYALEAPNRHRDAGGGVPA